MDGLVDVLVASPGKQELIKTGRQVRSVCFVEGIRAEGGGVTG
ncbi:MAG: hypothetical protein UX84_C0002G0074 [Microgenomates group bacterium GW2011_GWD1_47_13]|nr:MAG: hypothetical protein UX84_C0002G0074 [Microgenomates group bacterium GW2011_GWD1_47_13]